ncbi:hypothetical protein LAZ67_14001625 [Cordylochernes scorpioides]|uniref:Uncharacterized protein n=1 Tax=Cordylochernes scorpioides TaxID=51811 RepID=A0ABY6L697_9ARAC|nr:hypothetical protein LAZ67_14001625 [Cordylochernes scorpioides]
MDPSLRAGEASMGAKWTVLPALSLLLGGAVLILQLAVLPTADWARWPGGRYGLFWACRQRSPRVPETCEETEPDTAAAAAASLAHLTALAAFAALASLRFLQAARRLEAPTLGPVKLGLAKTGVALLLAWRRSSCPDGGWSGDGRSGPRYHPCLTPASLP